jgi:flagellar motor switch protein FliN/FliY
VTETIEYEQFEQSGNGSAPTLASASDVDLSRLSDIPMELSVEIGRTHMTVGETLDLRVGSVVTLERLAGETADLLVNGSAIARGEVVVIDEQYGLRITEILDGQSDPASSPEGELAQPAAGAAGSGDGDGQQDATPASVAAEPAAEAADGSPADEG